MGEANRRGGGNVRTVREVDVLTSIGPRGAGSDGERRASRELEKRLGELGRDATVQPIRVRPNFALTHLIHAVTGVVASVLSVYVPSAGLVLALAATVSAFGDFTGSFQLARLLTPARASQNVVSDEGGDKPGVIVLVAHYDAPVDAMLARGRLTLWPRAIFTSLAIITVCAIGRVIGIDAVWFTIIQFIPTVVLIASTPLFADAMLCETSEGRTDNAAGVAAVLRLARSHSEKLEHFDLMVVFTGASAHFALGMREWLKRHRRDLRPDATAVISLDRIGAGDPAYAVKEGAVFASRMHPTLVESAAEVGGTAYESREISDAYLARSAGLPTLRVSSTDADAPEPEAFKVVCDFTRALLERIDSEIGPRLS
jgi:Peptidase family M28